MKNTNYVFALILSIISLSLNAQNFPLERYQSEKVTYLGIDFTQTRFIDDIAFKSSTLLTTKYFKLWNHMIISEPDKYDFKKFTDKSDAIIDLNIMNERNSLVDSNLIVQNEFFDLKREDIPQIAQTIDFGQIDGMATFFVVGTFNKNALMATYFLVVYDISQAEVIFIKKYTAKPGGFGFKNYWARTYYDVLLQVEKDYKKKWSKGKS